MHEIELSGVDGSNLLGFLAALGTLRVLTLASSENPVWMSWREHGWWTPVIHHPSISSPDDLLTLVAKLVCGAHTINPAYLENSLELDCQAFGSRLVNSASHMHDRQVADAYVAIGSEFYPKKETQPTSTLWNAIGPSKKGKPVSGFLGYIRKICVETSIKQIQEALFEKWQYADPSPQMRWDPNEFRPHALRATDPAGDQKRSYVRGANRLGIEALPLLPTVPTVRGLRAVGFHVVGNEQWAQWPIWLDPIELETVKSLLCLSDLYELSRETLTRRHIPQVFRSDRVRETDYYFNFSPGKPLL